MMKLFLAALISLVLVSGARATQPTKEAQATNTPSDFNETLYYFTCGTTPCSNVVPSPGGGDGRLRYACNTHHLSYHDPIKSPSVSYACTSIVIRA